MAKWIIVLMRHTTEQPFLWFWKRAKNTDVKWVIQLDTATLQEIIDQIRREFNIPTTCVVELHRLDGSSVNKVEDFKDKELYVIALK